MLMGVNVCWVKFIFWKLIFCRFFGERWRECGKRGRFLRDFFGVFFCFLRIMFCKVSF